MDDVTMEERLRAALRHQADRAPGPHGVIAGFETRTRALRQRRRLLVAAAGVAVTAGIAGPVLATRHWKRRGGPAADPTPSAPPAGGGDMLPYQATWLPDGAVEYNRVLAVAGEEAGRMTRSWRAMVQGKDQKVIVRTEIGVQSAVPQGESVDVNGKSGYLDGDTTRADFTWWVTPTTMLQVMAYRARYDTSPGDRGLYRDLVLRVAKSVRPDGQTRLVTPVRFGWLPTGYQHNSSAMGSEGVEVPGWHSGVIAGGKARDSSFVRAELSTVSVKRPPGAEAVTVRGRAGWYRAYRSASDPDGIPRSSLLEIDSGKGFVVRVVTDPGGGSGPAPLDKAALIKVADSLTIDESPDFSWMGR